MKNLFTVFFIFSLFSCNRINNNHTKVEALFEAKKYEELISLIQKNLDANKNDTFSTYYLAKTYLEIRNIPASLNVANSIRPNQAWKERFLNVKYEAYSRNHDFENAFKNIDSLTMVNSNNSDYYLEKAITQYNLFTDGKGDNNLLEALKAVNISLKLNPKGNKAFIYRGVIRYGLDDNKGSIEDLNYYISNEDQDSFSISQAYRYIGNNLSDLKKYDSSLAVYSKALNFGPENGWVFYEKAEVESILKMNAEACKDFSKALELGVHEAANELKTKCN